MLKLKDNVNIEYLTKLGFVKFKISRSQTNYYFAVRRGGGRVILINNVAREILIDKIHEPQKSGDTRIHANIKWQHKNALIEDGIFELVSAGLVEKI